MEEIKVKGNVFENMLSFSVKSSTDEKETLTIDIINKENKDGE